MVPIPPAGTFTGAGTPYGLAVLEKQLAILSAAKVGERNTTLNRCAFIVAKHVAAGHLNEVAARRRLETCGRAIELTAEETSRTIDSAFGNSRANGLSGD